MSVLSDIPESLHEQLGKFLDVNKTWDMNQAVTVGLSVLLALSDNQEVVQTLQNLGQQGGRNES